jgi:hypothetical protein
MEKPEKKKRVKPVVTEEMRQAALKRIEANATKFNAELRAMGITDAVDDFLRWRKAGAI